MPEQNNNRDTQTNDVPGPMECLIMLCKAITYSELGWKDKLIMTRSLYAAVDF